ncbi:hydroxyphenylacetyl-CoA thioesterase PaaI [Nocardioides speluncae]|uniref:hydroxyphenylacetyl-CoA thioesterase PaaI n=1 Tax=Nocardioides speluncae TaxID=2670337 RepID=UPI000D687795|nr:hydroxyphenylacetyl-CoA thioesterase PaaI [Nocardioides speluncae]
MVIDPDPSSASRSQAHALHARDLTCQTLGIALTDVAPGWASVEMRVTKSMMNGHGKTHGGYLFLLADAAFAYACNTYGPVAVAQSAQVAFLRPAEVGDVLVAEAEERSRIGLHGIYDATVRRPSDDVVVAEFRGHSVILPGRRTP